MPINRPMIDDPTAIAIPQQERILIEILHALDRVNETLERLTSPEPPAETALERLTPPEPPAAADNREYKLRRIGGLILRAARNAPDSTIIRGKARHTVAYRDREWFNDALARLIDQDAVIYDAESELIIARWREDWP